MQQITLRRFILITSLIFSGFSNASTYIFSLGGWSDGGILNGQFETSFSAELDLYITTSEILYFEATYAGLHTFEFNQNDLGYFISDPNLGISFQLGTELNSGGPYIGDPFSFSFHEYVAYFENNQFSFTDETMVIQEVTSVPLPASAVLLISGLAALGRISVKKPNSALKSRPELPPI